MYCAAVLRCVLASSFTAGVSATVTAVIPTVGRPSLGSAVRSVLGQTRAVLEIIVVADTDRPISIPRDDRITVLHAGVGRGAAWCRQLGIDAASGSVIALLDDDDIWLKTKLARQLEAAEAVGCAEWVASSRLLVQGPGARWRTWPTRLIEPRESVPEYLFRFDRPTFGQAVLQTSTLCFPTELARTVRWDAHVDAVHDEPSWLIDLQRAIPGLRLIQLPDVLTIYRVAGWSVSRDTADRVDEYIDWGLQYLSAESPRVLGDYLCTSPVSAAVSADSLEGIRRSVGFALRHGRPGPHALAYAGLNAMRVIAGFSRTARHPR